MRIYFCIARAGLILLMVTPSCARADSVRLTAKKVQATKPVWILAKGAPLVNVHFEVTNGTECGTVNPADVATNTQGEAKSVFAASDPPTSCEATIKTTISHSADAKG